MPTNTVRQFELEAYEEGDNSGRVFLIECIIQQRSVDSRGKLVPQPFIKIFNIHPDSIERGVDLRLVRISQGLFRTKIGNRTFRCVDPEQDIMDEWQKGVF